MKNIWCSISASNDTWTKCIIRTPTISWDWLTPSYLVSVDLESLSSVPGRSHELGTSLSQKRKTGVGEPGADLSLPQWQGSCTATLGGTNHGALHTHCKDSGACRSRGCTQETALGAENNVRGL